MARDVQRRRRIAARRCVLALRPCRSRMPNCRRSMSGSMCRISMIFAGSVPFFSSSNTVIWFRCVLSRAGLARRDADARHDHRLQIHQIARPTRLPLRKACLSDAGRRRDDHLAGRLVDGDDRPGGPGWRLRRQEQGEREQRVRSWRGIIPVGRTVQPAAVAASLLLLVKHTPNPTITSIIRVAALSCAPFHASAWHHVCLVLAPGCLLWKR